MNSDWLTSSCSASSSASTFLFLNKSANQLDFSSMWKRRQSATYAWKQTLCCLLRQNLHLIAFYQTTILHGTEMLENQFPSKNADLKNGSTWRNGTNATNQKFNRIPIPPSRFNVARHPTQAYVSRNKQQKSIISASWPIHNTQQRWQTIVQI